MKVLFLVPPGAAPPSGGDLYAAQMAAGLRRLGHRVELSTSLPAPARVRADVVLQDELGFARLLPFNRALERVGCGAQRVALVHVTSARLSPRAATAAREAAFLASAHAAVFVSEQARSESLRLVRRAAPALRGPLRSLRVAVIPPGADRLPRRAAKPGPPGSLRLLCVGHLLPHKGQLGLLDAFAAWGNPEASLVLAGAAKDRRYAAQLFSRLRATARARWVGPLTGPALAGALARADVFVNASDYESWGMAAAEAQAAGVPVLSCTKGGLWEFLTPGVDSFRVRALHPGAFARLADHHFLARLTAGARGAATRCRPWSRAARELAAFLEAGARS